MNKIILPLDNKTWEESIKIMELTSGKVWGYKIRRQILEKGINIIKETKNYGKVMVDFKLFDIPSAINESLTIHFDAGADISTVHCTAQYRPNELIDTGKIAGITILTSMNGKDFTSSYGQHPGQLQNTVMELGAFGSSQGYGFIVCSPKDLRFLNGMQVLGIESICPGIRPKWYQKKDDQQRTMTPKEAINEGADYLVIGRPILKAKNILDAINRTNDEIGE